MALHLQNEINKLKKDILKLGAVVEDSVYQAVESIEKRDLKLAEDVIQRDSEIDQMEVDLEEECLKILALHQPVANDLRFVVAVLKINNDLERIGDLAGNIAERARLLASKDKIQIAFDFVAMAAKVQKMLKQSLDSFVNADVVLARQVCASDDDVDQINRTMYAQVQQLIPNNLDKLEQLIQHIAVSRNLERIADHATNIAEDVIYMIEGQIVRHTDVK